MMQVRKVKTTGGWKYGHVSSFIINVLPILISQELRTNEKGRFRMGQFTEKQLGASKTGLPLRRGDKVGYFILGSSIVLLFEAPKNFKFLVEPGQRVQFGQPLGKVHW